MPQITSRAPTRQRKDPHALRRRPRNIDDQEQYDDSQSDQSRASDDDDADADYGDLSDHEVSSVKPFTSRVPVVDDFGNLVDKLVDNHVHNNLDHHVEVLPSTIDVTSEPLHDIETTNLAHKVEHRLKLNPSSTKKVSESDPAFIPTRGAFFMHDKRDKNQSGGLSRGRKAAGNNTNNNHRFINPVNASQASQATNSQWSHDLHHTLESEASTTAGAGASAASSKQKQTNQTSNELHHIAITRVLGTASARVFFPNMQQSEITTFKLNRNSHTRIPIHRPPLRRDKPVRVFLPTHSVRFIFPSTERSFVFIPRNLRPNQQGFGSKTRNKSGFGSIGGFSSRRTSIYGGSMYSPSIAISRRSSFAASPAMSFSRPSSYLHSSSEIPIHRNLPIHQPRPQKAISVTGLEFPAAQFQDQDQREQQEKQQQQHQYQFIGESHSNFPHAFHHQTPSSYQESAYRPSSYTNSATLSNIPERAIQAQGFHPSYFYVPEPFYYGTGYEPNMPMFNMVPATLPLQQLPPPPPPHFITDNPAVIAHEQNGMIYYYDSQLASSTSAASESYQTFTMTPIQPTEGFYYTSYYPPQ